MPRFSANLSMLYPDLDLLDRIGAAARDGFRGVEYMSPYDHAPEVVRQRLDDHGMRQVLFNLPMGDWGAGERGIACLPGREAEFRDGVARAIDYAGALGCARVNCISGCLPEGVSRAEGWSVLEQNLAYAAPKLAAAGVRLLIEPINFHDMPGFILNTSKEAFILFERIGHENLWLQYDVYHMQRMQGALVETFAACQHRIAHVQIADTPGRHEPGTGEINYGFVLRELDRLGYDGWVGCEYHPLGDTSRGLAWRAALGFG